MSTTQNATPGPVNAVHYLNGNLAPSCGAAGGRLTPLVSDITCPACRGLMAPR